MLVPVCLTQLGQREGQAGGEQEHGVHHRQQDHQPVECPLVFRAGEVENTENKSF